MFMVLSSAMSRFSSLFLRDRHMDDAEIGVALGLSRLSFLAVPIIGAIADRAVAAGQGRSGLLFFLTGISVAVFLVQGIVDLGFVSPANSPIFLSVAQLMVSSTLGSQLPVFDALALSQLSDKSAYGHARLWGAISWGLVHLAIGICIDMTGTWILFFFTIITAAIYVVMLCVWRQNEGTHTSDSALLNETEEAETNVGRAGRSNAPGKSFCRNLAQQVRFACCTSPRITIFLVDVFFLGAGMAVVEGLLFLFFSNTLGASNTLLGATVIMTVIFEIPIFAVSEKVMKCLSPMQLMICAHLAYVVRVFGYTFVPSSMPGLVLLFEPLHGVTYALYQLTSVVALGKLAPKGLENSIQALRSSISSLGSLSGSVVGGVVLQYAGPDALYRGSGVLVALAGLGFLCSEKFCWAGRVQQGYYDMKESELSERPGGGETHQEVGVSAVCSNPEDMLNSIDVLPQGSEISFENSLGRGDVASVQRVVEDT